MHLQGFPASLHVDKVEPHFGDDRALLAAQGRKACDRGGVIRGVLGLLLKCGGRATLDSVKGRCIVCQYEELQRLSVLFSEALTRRWALALFICLWLPVGFLLLLLRHEHLGIWMLR